jgi:hypothetical protein
MRRSMGVLLCLITCLALTACPKDKNARDVAAALKGAIQTAQTEYSGACQANPSQATCVTINRAVAAQNLLITALENYCGWMQGAPPPDNTKCVPVSSAEAFLKTAVANANQSISEVKGIIK